MVETRRLLRQEHRNGTIWAAYLAGMTQEAIAETHGISQQRVSAIIQEVRESITPETRDDLIRREMDYLDKLRVQLNSMAEQELPPAFSTRGQILQDEFGRAVRDPSGRYAAIDRLIKLHERLAKLAGLDAPARADINMNDAAMAAADERAKLAVQRLSELGE